MELFAIYFLLFFFTSNIIATGTTECQHNLLGPSGKVAQPGFKKQTPLLMFYTSGHNLTTECVYAKSINKRILMLKFADVMLNDSAIQIKTIKKSPKTPWKTFRTLTEKSAEKVIKIRGVRYVKIVVPKDGVSFSLEYKVEKPPDIKCKPLPTEVKTIKCTKKSKANSKCTLTCREGFIPHKYIDVKDSRNFGATCRKVTRRSAKWQPSLNKTLCRIGKKIKKECKKFKYCVPVQKTTPDTEGEEETTFMKGKDELDPGTIMSSTTTTRSDLITQPDTTEPTHSTTDKFKWSLTKPIAHTTDTSKKTNDPTAPIIIYTIQTMARNNSTTHDTFRTKESVEPTPPAYFYPTSSKTLKDIETGTTKLRSAVAEQQAEITQNNVAQPSRFTVVESTKEIEPPPIHLYPEENSKVADAAEPTPTLNLYPVNNSDMQEAYTENDNLLNETETEPTPQSHLYPDTVNASTIDLDKTSNPVTQTTSTKTPSTTTITNPVITTTIPVTSSMTQPTTNITSVTTPKINTPKIIFSPPLTIKYCKRFCKRKRYETSYAQACTDFKGTGKKEFCMMCRYSPFKPCKRYSHFV